MYDISVIMTTYNAEDTVNRAVSSLLHKPFMNKIEVIIVDDCSTDTTPQIIQEFAEKYENIKVILLDKNTGSPSEPRNIGIREATGKYIAFLDDDDWIDVKILLEMAEYAEKNNLDCLKGYLTIVEQNRRYIANQIVSRNEISVIKNIIMQQSTTIDIILNREFLIENKILFNTNLKIGEDTVFYADVFSKTSAVGYFDKGFYFYNKIRGIELSTTQNYGDKELEMHLLVWELVEKQLNRIGLSYYQLRLPVAIKNVVMSLVTTKEKIISEETFIKLARFLKSQDQIKKKICMQSRYEKILDAVYAENYYSFVQACKKRILVAGYDLKFILPVIPYLEQHYTVLVDEWTGHDRHDEKQSKELLNQADIIWCEWLLGNAVWYSQHKQKHQKLVIRAHRFEITRDFGYKVNYDNVNRVFAVGYFYLEEFQRKFNIPRNKMQLLSNYVESGIYTGQKNEGYKYHIGLVGVTPKRKGFLKGLQLIKRLREIDERFQLYVIGNHPDETDWIMNNPAEKEYYRECSDYITENNLKETVTYTGWLEKTEMFRDIAFVLSLSDTEYPESFHLTPAEAYCDNTMGLFLAWPGVEYIYPENIVFSTIEEMETFILEIANDSTQYNRQLETVKKFIIENYDISLFLKKLYNILETL